MITLITGTPGAGKTLYTVAEVLPQYEGRTLYIDGIPELQTPHELPIGQLEEQTAVKGQTATPGHYADWLPEGAVLVVDEAQRIWRPRSAGSPTPPGVSAMETHRHHGHDIVLITQHPNLLDGNIRRLIGRHLHVRRVWGWNRALVYEWDHASDPNRVTQATKQSWSYPKAAFNLYKSASTHTNRGQKAPWLFYLMLASPFIFGAVAYQVYQSINAKTRPQAVAKSDVGSPGHAAKTDKPAVDLTNPASFSPVIPGQPITAPAYEELRKIQDFPRLSCVSSKTRCLCYTQQATRFQTDDFTCRRLAQQPDFDPYQADRNESAGLVGRAEGADVPATPAASAPGEDRPQVLSMATGV